MLSEQSDTCSRCGSDVVEARGSGRAYTLAGGATVPIPDDWLIHTCHACGTQQLATRAQLNQLLLLAAKKA